MVTPLTFVGDDVALVRALQAGHPGAAAAFYDKYASEVLRTLRATLGADADIPDLLQEVFIRAIDRIGDLDDLDRVRGWLTTIAIFTARARFSGQPLATLMGAMDASQPAAATTASAKAAATNRTVSQRRCIRAP